MSEKPTPPAESSPSRIQSSPSPHEATPPHAESSPGPLPSPPPMNAEGTPAAYQPPQYLPEVVNPAVVLPPPQFPHPPQAVQQVPAPEPFIPKDLSYDGLIYFAAWLQDQRKITNEQFNYLHKAAQQYRRTQEELAQTYNRMETARRALEGPGLPELVQTHSAPAGVSSNPSQAEQLVNLMNALAAAAGPQAPSQKEESTHSYLIKRGDQAEIEEIKAREENAKRASMTGAVGTVSSQPVSRQEMERQRRERYDALQRSSEEAAKKREDAERRQRALDAMWKNDGSSNIGKQ